MIAQRAFASPQTLWRVAEVAGLFAFVTAAAALVGHALNIEILGRLPRSAFAMKPNTALCSVLLGLSLFLAAAGDGRSLALNISRRVLAVAALTIGGVTAANYLTGANIPIDSFFLRAAQSGMGTLSPGRMAPATALIFSLLAAALAVRSERGRASGLVEGIELAALGLTALACFTSLYGLQPTTGFGSGARTAPRTALTLAILSVGSLLLDPDRGLIALLRSVGPAGGISRRLIPAAIVVPIIVGVAQMEGGRLGLYEPSYGLVFAVLVNIVILCSFVVWSARSIERSDRARADAEDETLRSEHRFRALNERFSLALRAANLGIWDWDIAEDRLEWDDRMFELYGVERGEFAGVVDAWRSRVHPEDAARAQDGLEAALRGERQYDTEFRVALPDGSLRFIRAYGQVTRDSAGRPLRMTGINFDISESKRAEAILHANERTLRLFVENSPAAVAMFDRDMRYILVSRDWIDSYKLQGQVLIGRSHYDVFPEIGEDWKSVHRRCLAGAVESREDDPFPRSDGSLDWVRWIVRPWYTAEGEIGGIIILSEVVTQKKKAELAIKASEERYRSLFNNMVEGLAYCKMEFEDDRPVDWIYLAVNPAFERLTGLAHIVGKKASEAIPGIREADPQLFEIYGRVATTGISERFEMNVHALDMWFSVAAYSPEKEFFVSVFDVITERKRAEEEVRKLNVELEERVKRRTAELETTNNELESFSYSVSHDLRAPLRGIDGWSLALKEEFGSVLNDTARDYLDRVRAETKHMGSLIDDLLQLSRVSRASLRSGRVDLSSLASAVSERARSAYAGRSIDVAIESGLWVRGDEGLLDIALFNLIDNAMKFTAPREKAMIELGTTSENGRRVFFLRDNGVGFDMTYAGKLFAPFQRLHRSSEFPGTGVGLATVRRIMGKHGGAIWVESRRNEGTTFYFTLGEDE